MGVVVKELVPAKLAEAAQTSQYTAAGVAAIIDKATVTNVSASNAALSVNLVAGGGSAGNGNLVVKAKTILPGECYTLPELVGQILNPGTFISTLADTADALALRVSGREVS
jgi:hypothetical protein